MVHAVPGLRPADFLERRIQIADPREQGSAPASGIPGTARNQRILPFEVPHKGFQKWQSMRPKRTKAQLRKLSALRKSLGDDLGEEVFIKWLTRQATPKAKADPVAVKIVEARASLENDPKFRLGNHGDTIRRVRGKGGSGFIASRNGKTGQPRIRLL